MFPQIKFRQTNVGADRGVCWSFMFGVWGGGGVLVGFLFWGVFLVCSGGFFVHQPFKDCFLHKIVTCNFQISV